MELVLLQDIIAALKSGMHNEMGLKEALHAVSKVLPAEEAIKETYEHGFAAGYECGYELGYNDAERDYNAQNIREWR